MTLDHDGTGKKDPETYAIIGAAMEVHRHMGHGFLENVYQEALTLEFKERDIPVQREFLLNIHYKNDFLKCSYKADFLCYQNVIVELKALSSIGGNEESQVINYLKASGFGKGLLINFGAPSLQYRRLVLTKSGNNLRKSVKSADIYLSDISNSQY